MSDDIIERLQSWRLSPDTPTRFVGLFRESEARIAELEAENKHRAPANMEQLEDMAAYIKDQDARIAELETENEALQVLLNDKSYIRELVALWDREQADE